MLEICSFLYPHQRTPLHQAAYRGNTDIVQYLTEKGADINIKDDNGVSGGDCNADQSLSSQVPDKGSGIYLYYCILSVGYLAN